MAAGKPVVSTKVGVLPEVVLEGETGLLVPPGDENAMAGALLELLRNSNVRIRMGEAGSERVVNQFSSEVMASRTEELYFELLDRRG
jgi:glycosyltransferase involved in cell wall biosynthesis